jgi:hypothetical protein
MVELSRSATPVQPVYISLNVIQKKALHKLNSSVQKRAIQNCYPEGTSPAQQDILFRWLTG